MKLNKWLQVILVSSSILTLVACSSHKKPDHSAVYAANASYNNGAEASGLGRESGFGDRAGGDRLLTKNVYYFDFDSNVVHETDKPAVMANANYLSTHSNAKVMLEGHTDPRGSREYNIGLGERRAKSIANIFTEKGVKPGQIRVVSYGAEKLASAGHAEPDYQKDRRAALVFLKK